MERSVQPNIQLAPDFAREAFGELPPLERAVALPEGDIAVVGLVPGDHHNGRDAIGGRLAQ